MPSKKTSTLKKSAKNNISITPLDDRVLLRSLEEGEKERVTDSGIIIPETVGKDQDSKRGKVVAVGPGKLEDGKRVSLQVKVGDTVMFSWGDELKIDSESYFIVSESNILAIIK